VRTLTADELRDLAERRGLYIEQLLADGNAHGISLGGSELCTPEVPPSGCGGKGSGEVPPLSRRIRCPSGPGGPGRRPDADGRRAAGPCGAAGPLHRNTVGRLAWHLPWRVKAGYRRGEGQRVGCASKEEQRGTLRALVACTLPGRIGGPGRRTNAHARRDAGPGGAAGLSIAHLLADSNVRGIPLGGCGLRTAILPWRKVMPGPHRREPTPPLRYLGARSHTQWVVLGLKGMVSLSSENRGVEVETSRDVWISHLPFDSLVPSYLCVTSGGGRHYLGA
jgi:hypothetical protein